MKFVFKFGLHNKQGKKELVRETAAVSGQEKPGAGMEPLWNRWLSTETGVCIQTITTSQIMYFGQVTYQS